VQRRIRNDRRWRRRLVFGDEVADQLTRVIAALRLRGRDAYQPMTNFGWIGLRSFGDDDLGVHGRMNRLSLQPDFFKELLARPQTGEDDLDVVLTMI